MAQTASDQDADPVINVIEQDVPGGSDGATPASGRAEAIDASAMGAVSARRRREFDAARARLRDQAIREDAGVFRQAGARAATDAPADADRVRAPLDEAPERVRKRYLRAGNQYFLKDAPYQLAFEDIGPYLVTEHNRPDVVESMVDMVHAKAWRRIRVSGHEAFRSEVWLQGTLLGIEVSGYQPKAADLARLAEARQARMDNRVEVVPDAMPATAAGGVNTRGQVDERRAAPPSPSSIPPAAAPVADMFPAAPGRDERGPSPGATDNTSASTDETDTPRRYAGELREHGGAPYQHNPARSDSYYVVFRDGAAIDHVVWGVDLERAMRESGAQIGQPVTLENLGRRLVTVRVPILDGEGVVMGEEEKDVYRHSWQVDVVPRNREAALSTPQPARPDPDSALPVDRSVPPAVEHALQRRRSTPSKPVPDGEQVMHLAVLTAAMREQGFSERSISRVQQRAARMLDSFGKEGIPVPVPKVFDPKAPSGRDRRARAVPERSPTREIDRTPAEPSMPSR